jgi:hypothetical protein
MRTWVVILVLFLWVAGGFGWVDAYEARHHRTMDWARGGLMLAFWPLFALGVATRELWGLLRDAVRTRL